MCCSDVQCVVVMCSALTCVTALDVVMCSVLICVDCSGCSDVGSRLPNTPTIYVPSLKDLHKKNALQSKTVKSLKVLPMTYKTPKFDHSETVTTLQYDIYVNGLSLPIQRL